ncbi:MAG TPA: 16S rRNA (guanine(966)-N(2))-methyltransferase RsmD [Terriglobales bacterium]|nr:16S rRNA (guanine(966)-N(2))-methyltransferase RsmD [Terriglobales bacterium]
MIAGQYRSRPLRSLRGMDIRPTADRLRETLFNMLTAGNPAGLEGSVWIDLFAGTGAVGIEALSRGAAKVYFVESSAAAARVIRQNLKSLQVESGFDVIQDDASKALRRLQAEGVLADFVFLDPPYRMERAYRHVLEFVGTSTLVKPEGTVIAEHEKRFDPGEEFGGLKAARKLVQGDAALRFYRRA